MSLSRGQRHVHVPSGGRRKPASSYSLSHLQKATDIVVGEPVSDAARVRLAELRARASSREERRTAPQKVFGVISAAPSPQEISEGRKTAEDFIAGLVAGARKRVIFVDPFFGPREARLFALRNPHQTVTIKVITGLKGLEGDAIDPNLPAGTKFGDVFVFDVDQLARASGVQPIEVRVMPGGDKSIVHDRYLIVDNVVWHCGPSFNELGERFGVMVRMPDPLSVRRFMSKVWCRSTPLKEFWANYKEGRTK